MGVFIHTYFNTIRRYYITLHYIKCLTMHMLFVTVGVWQWAELSPLPVPSWLFRCPSTAPSNHIHSIPNCIHNILY